MQVAAITGAHNLGGAAQYNAGYQGTWKPGNEDNGAVAALTFSNDFYKVMIDPGIKWFNVDASLKYNNTNETISQEAKWQWEGYYVDAPPLSPGEKPIFMLNTDFYVFFNITLNAEGQATCQLDTNCGRQGTCGLFGKCGLSPTYPLGLEYANVMHVFECISSFF